MALGVDTGSRTAHPRDEGCAERPELRVGAEEGMLEEGGTEAVVGLG